MATCDLPPVPAGDYRQVECRVLVLATSDRQELDGAGGPPCPALVPGRWRVEVGITTALNQGGRRANDRAQADLVVKGGPPEPEATTSFALGPRPLEVELHGRAADPDGEVVRYEWDFNGDGTYDWTSTVTGECTHVYDQVGDFYARLRVTDNDGLQATCTTRLIRVQPAATDDADQDGLSTADEARFKTDPANPDTDGDGLKDGLEVQLGLNPLLADSDRDGLSDPYELLALRWRRRRQRPRAGVGVQHALGRHEPRLPHLRRPRLRLDGAAFARRGALRPGRRGLRRGWVVDIGWRAVTTAVFSFTGLPPNARMETITDPGALIIYAIEYLGGTIPSEVAEAALKFAAGVTVKDVNGCNGAAGRGAGDPALFVAPR